MITVRFATGFSIQYNTAVDVKRDSFGKMLIDAKGYWIARIPEDCVVECVNACRAYHTVPQSPEISGSLDRMGRDIRSLTRKINKTGLSKTER